MSRTAYYHRTCKLHDGTILQIDYNGRTYIDKGNGIRRVKSTYHKAMDVSELLNEGNVYYVRRKPDGTIVDMTIETKQLLLNNMITLRRNGKSEMILNELKNTKPQG